MHHTPDRNTGQEVLHQVNRAMGVTTDQTVSRQNIPNGRSRKLPNVRLVGKRVSIAHHRQTCTIVQLLTSHLYNCTTVSSTSASGQNKKANVVLAFGGAVD